VFLGCLQCQWIALMDNNILSWKISNDKLFNPRVLLNCWPMFSIIQQEIWRKKTKLKKPTRMPDLSAYQKISFFKICIGRAPKRNHVYILEHIVEIGPNSSLQNQRVRWGVSFINSYQEFYLSNVGLGFFPIHLLTPSTIGLGACLNGGWPESISSDTMLKLGPTHPYKAGL